jgi:hypothetical protein
LALAGELKLLGELRSVVPRLLSVCLELLPGDNDAGQRGQSHQPLDKGGPGAVDSTGTLLTP